MESTIGEVPFLEDFLKVCSVEKREEEEINGGDMVFGIIFF
jgi:hypothetical protein